MLSCGPRPSRRAWDFIDALVRYEQSPEELIHELLAQLVGVQHLGRRLA